MDGVKYRHTVLVSAGRTGVCRGYIILNPVVDRSFKKRLDDGYTPLVGRAAPDIVFTIVGRSPTYLEWNGAPKRRPRGHAQQGSGSAGDAAIARHTQGGARIPLRGRTFLRKALLRPARSHSALLRLALHRKNCTLHPVQLPDLG